MAKIRDTVSAVALIAAGYDDEYVETVVPLTRKQIKKARQDILDVRLHWKIKIKAKEKK